MNRPGDYVHHISWSFARLLVPWTRGRWLAWTEDYGLRLISPWFHNCTRTGKW